MDTIKTEADLIVEQRTLRGLLPFSFVEIPSFQKGVVLKNGKPVEVLEPAKVRTIVGWKLFERYELWLVRDRKSFLTTDEQLISTTSDGWQINAWVTVGLQVCDPCGLLSQDKPVSNLQRRLFGLLQNQIGRHPYHEIGQALDIIGDDILAQAYPVAQSLGFALDTATCTWNPQKLNPKQVEADVVVNLAGRPVIPQPQINVNNSPPMALPNATEHCPTCGAVRRPGAKFCSGCGNRFRCQRILNE